MIKRFMQIVTIALTAVFLLPALSDAQNDVPTDVHRFTTAPGVERPYRVLLVRKKENSVHAYDPASEQVVFRQGPDRRHPFEVIEWALHSANVTAIMNGRIELDGTVNVPVSNTSLIVGPRAELVGPAKYYKNGAGDWYGVPNLPKIINVPNRDHVNIFNLGKFDSGGTKCYGAVFDGRNGGKNGINGGMLFHTGTVRNMGSAGYWIIDSANVNVPLAWGDRGWGNALVTIEGTDDTHVGFAAGILPNDAKNVTTAGELVDVQPRNRRARIDGILGTLVDGREEILDINNSPNTSVGKAVAYGKVDETKDELIGKRTRFIDRHSYSKRYARRATQKPFHSYFRKKPNSPGTQIESASIVNKNVTEWKTTVKTPGFPESLPVFKVKVRLKAVFEDGSTERVFAKNYRFDM